MGNEFLLFAANGAGISGALSVAALAFSGFAAWRANQQTVHLQRQADAALGDLLPNFSLRCVADGVQGERPVDSFLLTIENHNRRPIGLQAIALKEPKKSGFVAYRVDASREELIGSMNRKHDELETHIVVPGTRPGAPTVSSLSVKLVIVGLDGSSSRRRGRQVAVKVDYEVMSAVPEPHSELVKTRIR